MGISTALAYFLWPIERLGYVFWTLIRWTQYSSPRHLSSSAVGNWNNYRYSETIKCITVIVLRQLQELHQAVVAAVATVAE